MSWSSRAGLRLVVGLLLGIVGAASTAVLAIEIDFSSIPEPVLENFEQGVKNQLTSAREQVEAVINSDASDEESASALGQLGALYLLYDFMVESEACLRLARELAPEDPRWPYFLAVTLSFEGRKEEAAENLELVLRARPDDLASLIRLGDLLFDLERYDGARQNYLGVLEEQPDNAAALAGLGRVALAEGQLGEAVERLRRALELQPSADVLHYHLGMALRRSGDSAGAREQLALAGKQRVDFRDPLMSQLYAVNLSREAFFSRGIEALRRGERELAIEAFQQVIASHPEDAEAHYNVGMALVDMGRIDEAEGYLRKAVGYRGDYRDAHFNLGLLLGRKGAHEEAETHLRRAVEIDPEDLRARVRWANSLSRVGESERAVSELEAVLERDGAVAPARLSLGAIHLQRDNVEEATRQLEAVLALAPGAVTERSEAHYRLALLHSRDPERSDLTLEHLEKALELDPDFLDALDMHAGLLARGGRFEEAASQFERGLDLAPDNSRLHFGRVMSLLLGRLYPQAKRALESSAAALPENLEMRHALARFLATCPEPTLRDGERAARLAEQVGRAEPTPEHLETYAMALAELGRYDEAASFQRRIIEQERQTRGAPSPSRLARLQRYENSQPVREPWLEGQ